MNDEQLTNTQEAREGAQATEKSGYGSGSMMDTGDEVKAPESDAARKSAVDAVDDPDDEIGTTVEDIQAQIESTEEQVRIFHDLIAEVRSQHR